MYRMRCVQLQGRNHNENVKTEVTFVEETGITRLLKQLRQLSQELSADLGGSDVWRHAKLFGKLGSQTRSTISCTSLVIHSKPHGDTPIIDNAIIQSASSTHTSNTPGKYLYHIPAEDANSRPCGSLTTGAVNATCPGQRQYFQLRRFLSMFTFIPGSTCLLYTSPSPRDGLLSRMPSSA